MRWRCARRGDLDRRCARSTQSIPSAYARIVVTSAAVAGLHVSGGVGILACLRQGAGVALARHRAVAAARARCALARIAFADKLPFPAGTHGYDPNWVPLGAFAMLRQQFLHGISDREHGEGARRIAPAPDRAGRSADRHRQPPRVHRDAASALLQRTLAEGKPAAVLVLDLDLFKNINDTFGHQTGDRVLCAFCETASETLRPNDLFGRMGGEEFACLLPGASAANALQVAERIRASFEGRRVNAARRCRPRPSASALRWRATSAAISRRCWRRPTARSIRPRPRAATASNRRAQSSPPLGMQPTPATAAEMSPAMQLPSVIKSPRRTPRRNSRFFQDHLV